MKAEVLIANRAHKNLLYGLRDLGYAVEYRPEISHEEFKQNAHKYYGLVVNTRNPVRKSIIDKAEKLKFIARLGSGMEIIDVDYAEQKGIQVFSAPEGNANAVAEHTLSLLFSLFNKIPQAYNSVRNFHWEREKHRGRELQGLTVGVIGVGNNGSALVHKLQSLNVKIYCYDKYKQHYIKDERSVKECMNMEELLRHSDVVSLHIPLTEETRNLVDADFLARCKDGATLINTSRGAIVELGALIDALESGKLYGACLDVLPNEKISCLSANERQELEKLFQYNTVLSPHIAGWTVESYRKISDVLLRKLKAWESEK